MRKSTVIAVLLTVILQATLFVLTWDSLVEYAKSIGREQRGGVAFGISVYCGFILLVFVFLIAYFVVAAAHKPLTRWLGIFVPLVCWLMLFSYSSDYPIRGTVFGALGALILVAGSGVLLPQLIRVFDRAGKKRCEQAAAPNRSAAQNLKSESSLRDSED